VVAQGHGASPLRFDVAPARIEDALPLVEDSVELVMAQRLVRKICPDCKEEVEVTPQILERLGLPAGEKIAIYHGKGCDKCYGTGYRGRTSINEVMTMSNKIKKMMLSDVGDLEIKETAIQEGMRTLRAQAIEKLKAGVTTIEEVLGVTTTM
jgi:type IV pilus assembly protein PilB